MMIMSPESQSRAEHHYCEAEATLAALGAVGPEPEDALRELLAAATHALLAVAASVMQSSSPC